MGYTCDFCGNQRSMVYCQSDAACLCLSCDRNVHSANALSRRHSRTLVCERCNSQSAFLRCVEEKVSLCQNCDWLAHGHGSSVSTSTHKREAVNCYSGCPSSSELSTIWSFMSDSQAVRDSTCKQEMGLTSIDENCSTDITNMLTSDKSSSWVGLSWLPESSSRPHIPNWPAGPTNASSTKSHCIHAVTFEPCEDDDLYKDFNMDEVDLDLDLENYAELFDMTLSNSQDLLENGGIDSLFETKDLSTADSSCQSVAEGSTVGVSNPIQPACSRAASADSTVSSKTEPILCFSRQGHASLSFSSIAVNSSGGDYQKLLGETPWGSPCREISLHSANRTNAVMRYKEKKKRRKFDKNVRYASRKARADVRRRVKGRFIKAGEAYDYDPLSQTRSY